MFRIFFILSLIISIASCATYSKERKAEKEKKKIEKFEKKVKIDTDKVIEKGIQTIDETQRLGPQPIPEGLDIKKDRRVIIKEETPVYGQSSALSQLEETFPITLNLDNVEINAAMRMIGDLINKNILVGEEVQGSVTVYIKDEPWDKALAAILEVKGLAQTIEPNSTLIRIHKKEVILQQEKYKRDRAKNLQEAIEFEKQNMPTRSEMFRLFYSEPSVIKTQLEDVLFRKEGTAEASQLKGPVSISEDARQNALIIKGTKDDLDLIEKMVDAIDVRTQQILIEAFVVRANLDFDNALGSRFGANYKRRRDLQGRDPDGTGVKDPNEVTLGGTTGTAGDVDLTAPTVGNISSLGTAAGTAGIGFLYNLGANRLKFELEALEREGLTTILSNPKVFTLNNQTATITQGTEIPYQVAAEGANVSNTEFREAALKLEVTPSIVGDGNIVISVQVNDDSIGSKEVGTQPTIDKMEIITKLLVEDGSIVVIGGIISDQDVDTKNTTPGMSKIPLLGAFFSSKERNIDKKQLLVFIAPRVV